MSLDIGVNVIQYLQSSHRQGVIYKKRLNRKTGWAYFEILWATGERSTERADQIKTSSDIESQFTDLVVLRDLQESILSGGLYD